MAEIGVGMQAGAPPSAQPPVLLLTPADVRDLTGELSVYCAQFAPLFRRSEQRRWARKYLEGQLLDLPRKSIEPLALALAGGNATRTPFFTCCATSRSTTALPLRRTAVLPLGHISAVPSYLTL